MRESCSAAEGSIATSASVTACLCTSAAESAFGVSPLSAHRPSLAILMGTAS